MLDLGKRVLAAEAESARQVAREQERSLA
jgi:hypothetical protein